MWDETNFLVKGFINEVKGVLSVDGSSGGSGVYASIAAICVCVDDVYAGDYTKV